METTSDDGSGAVEVPYTAAELQTTARGELVELVLRQAEKWPMNDRRRFGTREARLGAIRKAVQKAASNTLRKALVNPTHGFSRPRGPADVVHRTAAICGTPPAAAGDDRSSAIDGGVVSNVRSAGKSREGVADDYSPSSDLPGPLSPHIQDDATSGAGDPEPAARTSAGLENEGLRANTNQVRILLHDLRRDDKLAKTTFRVTLTVIDSEECSPDHWCASTCELLQELQRRAGASLADPVKISYPYADQPEYYQDIVVTAPGESLEHGVPDLQYLQVPMSNTLRLVVEHGITPLRDDQGTRGWSPSDPVRDVSRASSSTPVAGPSGLQGGGGDDLQSHQQKMLAVSARATDSDKQVRRDKRLAISARIVDWLSGEAAKRVGYQAFKQGRYRPQHNPDIVASWRFAVEFCGAFLRAPCLTTAGKMTHATKGHIEQALGVGSTWMADAEKAVRLLERFGEGGTDERPAVVDRVKVSEGKREGSGSLLAFLKAQQDAE
ncbi:hypothetical protein BV22DRAFT_1041732 [Leucogyrophana mollusca]|uniref:Uncharacterized protein n=1 Tax=Leucogyrophana mollusca TaxID=85980 RepID=A0ACB8AY68_9AGAM|nr:hypothetical protein BV22DRAFT_1041732 [Leucogyrophana mollusca]